MNITIYTKGFFVACEDDEKESILNRINDTISTVKDYPIKKIKHPQANEKEGTNETVIIFNRNKSLHKTLKTLLKFCSKDKTRPFFAYPFIEKGIISASDGCRAIQFKDDHFNNLKTGMYSTSFNKDSIIFSRLPGTDQAPFPNISKVLPNEGMCIIESMEKSKESSIAHLTYYCTRFNPVNPDFLKDVSEMPGPFNIYQTAQDKTIAITGNDYIVVIMPMIRIHERRS